MNARGRSGTAASRVLSGWPALARALALALALVPQGSAHARKDGPPRPRAIDMVVIHSTGGPTCDAATGQAIWVPGGKLEDNIRTIEAHPTLGIHYMIDRDGTLRASVPEDQLAHHVFRYSERSIAVELINDGDGVDPFPAAQIDALVALLRDIAGRRQVPRGAVVRHADLDQGRMPCDRSRRRKVDPGAAFPYQHVLDRVFGNPAPAAVTPAASAPGMPP